MNIVLRITLFVMFFLSSNSLFAQPEDNNIDSSISHFDTFSINNRLYAGYIKHDSFYVVANDIVIINIKDNYSGWCLKDINEDGFNDILLNISGCTDLVFDLLMFIPSKNIFENIENFSLFPAATVISGTKYYYSYHKSGCADMAWDSDLFYIKNCKAVRAGNIHGDQCKEDDKNMGKLYVYKIYGDKKRLIHTLSSDILSFYKDYKWGFIKEYWSKNYSDFKNSPKLK